MSLAALLQKLRPLVSAETIEWSKINALLRRRSGLAEYEVARLYVARMATPNLSKLARSVDPRERTQAAKAIRLCCTRPEAAKLLRPLIKDVDGHVRSAAHASVRSLALEDVALPDTRFKPPKRPDSRRPGGWNPTGWSFGLFGERYWGWSYGSDKKKKASKKPDLAKLGVPALTTVAELLKWLGLRSKAELKRLMRPGAGTGSPYVQFTIPKSSGEPRTITAPRIKLKRIQRKILDEVLAKLAPHEAAHGFVRGRSVLSNARPHKGAKLVVKMDLRDFFPSISYNRVVGLFSSYGFADEVAWALAGLVTHRAVLPDGFVLWPGVLPQGAPTSPALANLLCRRLDSRLSGLAKRAGAAYTRYADDMTFSFKVPPAGKSSDKSEVPSNKPKSDGPNLGRFLWWVEQVCLQEGFIENTAKRRVLRASGQQRVTGIVVNSGLSVPREARRGFRALLHNCKVSGVDSQARGRKDFRAYLLGYASYIKMVHPALGKRLVREVREVLSQSPTTQGAS